VRVHESGGRIMHSGLSPAGSTLDLSGKAPMVLIVGNAEHVHLNYKGRPVDLKPFTSVNVARLTLNQ
jgi:cytoskeleton protein RodZ